jgi:hypothetical protein
MRVIGGREEGTRRPASGAADMMLHECGHGFRRRRTAGYFLMLLQHWESRGRVKTRFAAGVEALGRITME